MDTSGTTLQNALTRIANLERELVELQAAFFSSDPNVREAWIAAQSAIESSDTAKVVRDNLPYLENLILPHGHESPLLRQHPAPCQGHDFCLMHQAQKGADAIRVALDSASADNTKAQEGKEP